MLGARAGAQLAAYEGLLGLHGWSGARAAALGLAEALGGPGARAVDELAEVCALQTKQRFLSAAAASLDRLEALEVAAHAALGAFARWVWFWHPL